MALHKDWPHKPVCFKSCIFGNIDTKDPQGSRPERGCVSHEKVMHWLQAERLSKRMELRLKEAEERVSDLDARASIAKQRISILERELETSRDMQKQLQDELAAATAQAADDKRVLQVKVLICGQHMACIFTGSTLPRWTGSMITAQKCTRWKLRSQKVHAEHPLVGERKALQAVILRRARWTS